MAAEMTLTPDQKRDFATWLKARDVKACPICDKRHWAIGDHLVASRAIVKGDASSAGTAYPLAMLVCGNCAYTAFFNAVVVGLVSRE